MDSVILGIVGLGSGVAGGLFSFLAGRRARKLGNESSAFSLYTKVLEALAHCENRNAANTRKMDDMNRKIQELENRIVVLATATPP